MQEEDDSDVRYPPPITTGFNQSEAIVSQTPLCQLNVLVI